MLLFQLHFWKLSTSMLEDGWSWGYVSFFFLFFSLSLQAFTISSSSKKIKFRRKSNLAPFCLWQWRLPANKQTKKPLQNLQTWRLGENKENILGALWTCTFSPEKSEVEKTMIHTLAVVLSGRFEKCDLFSLWILLKEEMKMHHFNEHGFTISTMLFFFSYISIVHFFCLVSAPTW